MTSELFKPEFFARNRRCLRQLAKTDGPIVVTANGLLQRSADSPFSFQQDSSFWYLTGIDEPDVILVMDSKEEYLILPVRSDYQNIFSGSIETSNLSRTPGVKNILPEADGWKKLSVKLKKADHAGTVFASPTYIKSHGMYTNPARARLIKKLKRHNPKLELVDLRETLTSMRMIKQPPEIAAIQKAVDITTQAFESVKSRAYKYEYELEADLTQLFRKAGAQGHAYEPIVAGGANACVLHYIKNAGSIKSGDLVLIDAGAEYKHYAADITRAFNFGQKPTSRQKTVHEAVLAVQDFALSLLKPGALIRENEQQIEKFMGKQLQTLGLIKAVSSKSARQYYPHSASHFLGLDVHDAGDYKQALAPGMVLTCEPGIYIPDEGIGVRIEDDVLITPAGHKVLSQRLSRALL